MTDTPTHALTIHQPYAWAVAAGHKPVENRTWRPPLEAVGKLIGIHAGKRSPDLEPCECGCGVYRHAWPGRALGIEVPQAITRGALIGVARLVGVCRPHPNGPDVGFQEQTGRGNVWSDLDPEDCALIAPWAKPGRVLWRWREAVLLPEPIPMRGQQGLWRLRCDACGRGPRDHDEVVCSGSLPWRSALEQWREARETRWASA